MLETASGPLWRRVQRRDPEATRFAVERGHHIEASDLAGFQARLKAAGCTIVDPLAERPWGQSEFTVEDNEGNWSAFWQASSTG